MRKVEWIILLHELSPLGNKTMGFMCYATSIKKIYSWGLLLITLCPYLYTHSLTHSPMIPQLLPLSAVDSGGKQDPGNWSRTAHLTPSLRPRLSFVSCRRFDLFGSVLVFCRPRRNFALCQLKRVKRREGLHMWWDASWLVVDFTGVFEQSVWGNSKVYIISVNSRKETIFVKGRLWDHQWKPALCQDFTT